LHELRLVEARPLKNQPLGPSEAGPPI
jgi:hypothetical protein